MAANAVSTSLPQVTLQPGSTITVTGDAAGALVTQLVVKMFQVTPDIRASAAPILVRRGGV